MAPITYNIDYGANHVGSAEYVKKILEAPPQLLHVGEDVPISSVYGTKAGYAGNESKPLTADEVRAKIAALTDYVAALHRAGVQWVIPYINNKAVIGDHVKRTGFWEFYDHWDRFAPFGFGPRPPGDMPQMQYPFWRPTVPKKDHHFYPRKLYQMCDNHPTWRQYLLGVTANVARCGYDGVFVDEMSMRDYCPYDEKKFREYLAARYTAAERRRRFGRAELETLAMGYPGDGALWYDTQAFWSDTIAQLLRAIRDEGRKTKPDFFVIPNYGPFAHFDGIIKRVPSGKDPAAWAPHCRMIMFEEMQRPGQLAAKIFHDHILQYKMAFALGFRAGLLSYLAREAPGVELSMAEAAAGGGGALIQPYYEVPELRRRYRRFFGEHADLFDGYESHADVGVLFAYDQLYWGNQSHVQAIYRLSTYLSNEHVLWDLVPPGADLGRYKAVITPELKYLSDQAVDQLNRFAARGGVWLDIGDSGRFDEAGLPRSKPANLRALRRRSLDELVEYPSFALYFMREDDANEIKEVAAYVAAAEARELPPPLIKPTEDLRALLEAKTGAPLSVVPASGLEGLRASVWRKPGKLVAHFVNYHCPIPTQVQMGKGGFKVETPPEQYQPRPLENVAARLRVPAGQVTAVRAFDADAAEPVALEFKQGGGVVEFTMPRVGIYSIVQVGLR